jgi:cell division septation protein DedD
MADEELHEIQLNGKQLVFLFMAGTVAAVVIFLCGLMVGRNLRSPRLEAAAVSADTAVSDPTRAIDLPPPSGSTTESGTPATANEDLSYTERLEAPKPVEEHLRDEDRPLTDPTRPPAPAKPEVKAPSAPAAAPKTPAAAPPARQPASSTRPAAAVPAKHTAEPADNGWAVQVQAVTAKSEADAIAKRLVAKGYPAFVMPTSTTPVRYRIRVGKYPNKRDADAIGAKLKKEEQFNPWVTR